MLGGVVGGRRKYIWVGSNARLGSFASACPDHGDFRSTPVTGHSQLAGRISEAQSALCCATSVACTTLRPMPDYRRAFVPGGCWFFTVNPRYRRCCVASRASEIPQVECDISTRRANQFRYSEVVSSPKFPKIKNIPLPFHPKSPAHLCASRPTQRGVGRRHDEGRGCGGR